MAERVERILSHLSPSQGSVLEPANVSGKITSPRDTLQQERRSSSFNSQDLTHFLDGGKGNSELKEKLMMLLERDPFLRNRNPDLSRLDQRELSIKMFARIIPLLNSQPDEESRRTLSTLISLVDPGLSTRLALQFTLFLGAMRGQATPELYEEYEKLGMVNMKKVVGCFAMTELGHGSNVAGLETTATLDLATDEFILHTPSITASKWWIGGAAMTATHAAVYARLLVKGKDHGVKVFLVQLRNPETFALLPGVSIGDCGHKMGRNGLDNGWIQFSSVRIPRTHMLMKHTAVDREGNVRQSAMEQINYGPLVHGRVAILASCSENAKKALTISIRYGAARRQFKNGDDEAESAILNYTTHQYRLFPLLALTYAIHFCSAEMGASTRRLMKRLAGLKGTEDKAVVEEVMESLKEMHGSSAGLKAYCTWGTLKIIEECRQSLGGHGYSTYSALPTMYQEFSVNCSWEGDNTILTLQTGKYLISCWKEVKRGTTLKSPGVRYLNDFFKQPKKASSIASSKDLSLPALLEALAFGTAALVAKAAERYQTVAQLTSNENLAQQESSIELLACVRSHCQFYLVDRFNNAIQRAPATVKDVLTRLAILYALTCINENLGIYLQSGYLLPHQSEMIERQIFNACQDLRKDAVALVDAFNLSDFLVESPLGARDGDIYEKYFTTVKQAPHGFFEQPPYFDRLLKPFINGN